MTDLEKLKELDRRAKNLPHPMIDVTGAVLTRVRAGERADARIMGDAGPIGILAGASLVAVAAALVVVVVVWMTMDSSLDSIETVAQQTTEWLL